MKTQNIYLNVIGKTRCFKVDTIRIPWKENIYGFICMDGNSQRD